MRMESPLNQRLRRSPPDVVYTPIDVTSEIRPLDAAIEVSGATAPRAEPVAVRVGLLLLPGELLPRCHDGSGISVTPLGCWCRPREAHGADNCSTSSPHADTKSRRSSCARKSSSCIQRRRVTGPTLASLAPSDRVGDATRYGKTACCRGVSLYCFFVSLCISSRETHRDIVLA